LDGHVGGHYLTALAQMVASTGDPRMRQRLDQMVRELAECQQAHGNGYVGGVPNGRALWADIAAGRIQAEGFSLNKRWVPLYNLHKLWAGLRDAWLIVGNEQAVAEAIRPVPGKPMTFTAPTVVRPEKYRSLEWVPFFRVHDARYMLYWPLDVPEQEENTGK
jgi:hypothetical protein